MIFALWLYYYNWEYVIIMASGFYSHAIYLLLFYSVAVICSTIFACFAVHTETCSRIICVCISVILTNSLLYFFIYFIHCILSKNFLFFLLNNFTTSIRVAKKKASKKKNEKMKKKFFLHKRIPLNSESVFSFSETFFFFFLA